MFYGNFLFVSGTDLSLDINYWFIIVVFRIMQVERK